MIERVILDLKELYITQDNVINNKLIFNDVPELTYSDVSSILLDNNILISPTTTCGFWRSTCTYNILDLFNRDITDFPDISFEEDIYTFTIIKIGYNLIILKKILTEEELINEKIKQALYILHKDANTVTIDDLLNLQKIEHKLLKKYHYMDNSSLLYNQNPKRWKVTGITPDELANKFIEIDKLLKEIRAPKTTSGAGGKKSGKSLESKTVVELKKNAAKRGIKVVGLKKADIIAKLRH